MPERLCFVDYPAATAAFFTQLRRTICSPKWQEVNIDHSPLTEISPAAALVLVAELFYGHKKQRFIRKVWIFPKIQKVRDLLGLIGYFKYFKNVVSALQTSVLGSSSEHRRGEGVDRLAASALVDHLRTLGKLSTSLLYEALIEGMQNADEHGYGGVAARYRSWWLLRIQTQTPVKSHIVFTTRD